MATAGAVIARILTQYSDKGSKAAQKDIAKLGKNIDSFNKKLIKSFAVASAAATAFAIKIGKDAVTAAIEDSKSAAILAKTLQNVTGATDTAIAAVEEYISKQQMAAGVADDELRQSLGRLVSATGNVTTAQALQTAALDIAAGTGKSLATVTEALVKATLGNVGALKKLGVPLSDTIVKNKDLAAALKVANEAFGGQAKVAADKDPFTRLRLSYQEILETLGYALLPVVIDFTNYIKTELLPQLENWIATNKTLLAEGLRDVTELVKGLLEASIKTTAFIAKYKELFIVIAGIAAAVKTILMLSVFNKVLTMIATTATLVGVKLGLLPAATTIATKGFARFTPILRIVSTLFSTIGKLLLKMPLWAKIAGAALISLSAGLGYLTKKQNDNAESAIALANAQRLSANSIKNSILEGFKPIEEATAAAQEQAKYAKELAKINAAAAAQAAKDAAKKIALEKQYAQLRKFGIVTKEEDPVQLNAAIALLARQKDINKLDLERVNRMKEEIISMRVRNDLAARYQDILKALADSKIDDKELIVLAKIWGVPVEAAKTYIETLFAIEDATITDDEIIKLAMSWGSTQEQAAQYLDFFQALNDGFLSDAEIEKLRTKWGMTEEQVRMYADFVGIVNDGKLEDAEIIKIQQKWKLTTDQVVDYIKKIGAPVSYSGTLIDPARAAEIGWLNATAALQRYLDLLKKGTGVIIPGGVPGGNNGNNGNNGINGNDPAVIAAATAAAAAASAAAADAAAAEAEAAAAVAESEAALNATAARSYAISKLIGDTEGMMMAAAQVTPTILAAAESGAIGAASIAAQLVAAEKQLAFDRNMATYAAFQQKERADAAAAAAASSMSSGSNYDYDERFRFKNNPNSTINTAQGINTGNLMAAPVVNITVQGSVTAEQDLVTAVRNGLLATQYNGNQLLLEAI